uniref:Uncharacterized protein n=1 Tax=Arundo donax TaxID=35708 RepID=A0A0A8YP38_ARUDO
MNSENSFTRKDTSLLLMAYGIFLSGK